MIREPGDPVRWVVGGSVENATGGSTRVGRVAPPVANLISSSRGSNRPGNRARSSFGTPSPMGSAYIDRYRYVDIPIDHRQYVLVRLIQTIDAECCAQVLAAPLGETESERLAAALRVLADPARLRLLSIIGAQPDGEACVCNLTTPLGLSQPTVSHHLKVLTEAGLLGREKRGRWVYYWVRPEPLELLRGALEAPIGAVR